MPCWSELWHNVTESGWLFELAGIFSLIALSLWAPGLKWRWLRIAFRVAGGVALLYVLAIVAIGMLLSSGDPKPQYRTIISPNGMYQATLTYQAGFLGRDNSRVELTKTGRCRHFAVYDYEGPSSLAGTTMRWLDNSHLEVEYRADPNRYQECASKASGVRIVCVPMTAEK